MKSSIKHWIFRLKYLVAIVVFLVAIGFVGESSWINRIAQQSEITRLKAEIDEYTRRFDNDRETLESLKTDREAIKEVARGRYYMKTDDEDIFIVETEEEHDN